MRWYPTSEMLKIFCQCLGIAGRTECWDLWCKPRKQLFHPSPLSFLGELVPLTLMSNSLSIMGFVTKRSRNEHSLQ